MEREKQMILIVEDEKDLREAVAAVLRTEGYSVYTAKDAQSGIEKALKEKPDLMLLDIGLPDHMTGHDVLSEIRKDEWGKNAKVIFLTAFSDPENVIHAVEKGTIDYLVKPEVSLDDIVKKVKETLL